MAKFDDNWPSDPQVKMAKKKKDQRKKSAAKHNGHSYVWPQTMDIYYRAKLRPRVGMCCHFMSRIWEQLKVGLKDLALFVQTYS